MAIDFRKYVLITSGVGGGNAVPKRELIGRLYTANPLVPTGAILEFSLPTQLADIGIYFGTTSEEYLRAVFYSSFISKSINRAKKISYARWTDEDVAPRIYGGIDTKAVGDFTSITDGSFDLTIGGVSHTITTNFSTATTLADVASLIQTQIQTETEAQFATATVTFNATRNSFDFVGGVAEVATIEVTTSGTGTDITTLIGWNFSAIFSDGALTQSITNVLDDTYDKSNNFGSYLFIPTLTLDEIVESANWNKSQNVFFQYYVPVDRANTTTYSEALIDIGGTGLVLQSDVAGEYHEMLPMVILASTDYTKVNSTKNFMFYEASLTPTVTTTSESNSLDTLRINYYGQTQTAGQFIEFFQRGVLMGLSTDPVSMNTYANEQWFKDSVGSEIMSLLLSLEKVSANIVGIGQLKTTLQSVIDLALDNGVISVGKDLNNTQKLFIGQITNDDLAYVQVENVGYWFDVEVQSYVATSGITEYKAVYTIIYSKDDVIRSVDGTHILI